MDKALKRINIVIYSEQYEALVQRKLNVSGLIRDLLGDYLSDSKITLQVSEDTKELYDRIIANTGASDAELEPALRSSLTGLLEKKIEEMQSLHRNLVKQG